MSSARSTVYRSVPASVPASVLAIVLLVLLALTAACRPARETQLDANSNGRQIEVSQGQTIVVTLEANPSTGYSWERAEAQEDILQQVGEPEFTNRSNLVGAPGTETLRFKAAQAGQTELKLVYHRPWETGVAPEETFTVQVVVR
jgi:inhibitor of cysteine peptidase